MRHVGRDREREFYVTTECAVGFEPRGLVDELVDTLLLDCVGVDVMVFEQAMKDFGCARWVALEEGFSDDVAVRGISLT